MKSRASGRQLWRNLALSFAVFLLSLLLLELVAGWLVQPSDESYGTLLGIELPGNVPDMVLFYDSVNEVIAIQPLATKH